MSFNKHVPDFNSYWYNFLFTSVEQDYFYYKEQMLLLSNNLLQK